MGRPSRLSEEQWMEIVRRSHAGEAVRALAREFSISEGAIRIQLEKRLPELEAVAKQLLAAEQRFKALPYLAQVTAQSLLEDLKAVSTHLASAAKFGAMTAHRLSHIAHGQTDKIDPIDPLGIETSALALRSVVVLTEAANKSSTVGLNLLAANKDKVKTNDAPEHATGLGAFYGDEEADTQSGSSVLLDREG